jgi:hypothetical protein
MDGLHLHAGLADHRAVRPILYSSKSASRVTTDPEKKAHKHKSSHHHHDGRDGHHRHSSSRRHAAKEAMQSAIQIQPPTSFGDLLRQARGSRDTSPSHSRRESVAPGQLDGSVNGKEHGAGGLTLPPRRPLRPADVELEATRVEARERYVCVMHGFTMHFSTSLYKMPSLTWHTETFVRPSNHSPTNR